MIIIINSRTANPKIKLIYTGGTIGSTRDENGLRPTLSVEEILERVPHIYNIVGGREYITLSDSLRVDSADMRYGDRIRLAREIFEARRQGFDSVVILHGTDQMANTATDLSLIYPFKDFPVIITGSMLPMGYPNSDAPSHVLGAVAVAASRNPRLVGDFVLFNDSLLRGTRAVKTGREQVIFESPNYSTIATTKYSLLHRPHVEFTKRGKSSQLAYEARTSEWLSRLGDQYLFDYPPEINERVGLIELYTDFSADTVNEQVKRLQGVVIKSWGVGGIPDTPQGRALSDKIEKWCEGGKVVVVASRVPYFRVDLTKYEVGMRALKAGAISAEDMNPDVALSKLRWGVGMTANGKKPEPTVIKKLVLYNLADEIDTRNVPQDLRMSDEEVEAILRDALRRKDETFPTEYARQLLGDTNAAVHNLRRPRAAKSS